MVANQQRTNEEETHLAAVVLQYLEGCETSEVSNMLELIPTIPPEQSLKFLRVSFFQLTD